MPAYWGQPVAAGQLSGNIKYRLDTSISLGEGSPRPQGIDMVSLTRLEENVWDILTFADHFDRGRLGSISNKGLIHASDPEDETDGYPWSCYGHNGGVQLNFNVQAFSRLSSKIRSGWSSVTDPWPAWNSISLQVQRTPTLKEPNQSDVETISTVQALMLQSSRTK